MLNLLPPAESIDDVCQWISPNDPAWDSERTKAEQKVLGDLAVAALDEMEDNPTLTDAEREAAVAALDVLKVQAHYDASITHPLSVWLGGGSRFSHDALLTVPEAIRSDEHPASSVTIGEYLTGTPTIFEIRRLGAREYRSTMMINVEDPETPWHQAFARHGLVRIIGVGNNTIEAPRGSDGLVEWAWIDWLHKFDPSLVIRLGWAVYYICEGENARGKP